MIYQVKKVLEYKGKIYQPNDLIKIDDLAEVKKLGDKVKKLKKRTKTITDFKIK